MSASSGGEDYRSDNVIRPRVFESGSLPKGGTSLDGGDGDGGGGMLEARVARLEADVAHIQRDLTAVQADVKAISFAVADVRKDVATLVANSGHLATREWVLLRGGAAVVVTVTATAGLIGFAPKVQSLFGTTAQQASASQAAAASTR